MAQPWQTIDKVDTADGVLELRKRGETRFSDPHQQPRAHEQQREPVRDRPRRTCLQENSNTPPAAGADRRSGHGAHPARCARCPCLIAAQVIVAELNPVIVTWCRGPLAELTNRAVDDPRVSVVIDDVAAVIARAAQPGAEQFDAIIIDLYEGPGASSNALHDPFYGSRALKTTAAALSSGGVFAVWGENPDAAFEKRLAVAGFIVDRQRPGRGGLRHVVYVAQKK